MARTLALAPRTDSSPLKHYTWSFPGSPVNVQLSLGVVERLQQRLEKSGDAMGEHGILWGRTVAQKTEITQFTTIPNHQPSSVLEAVSRPASGWDPVGYYRIHTDAALRMSDDDVALAHSVFAEPHQVFLLIQPGETSPATATFFFWDQGRLCGDFPFLEFPLDPDLLASAERQRSLALEQKRGPHASQAIDIHRDTHAPQTNFSKTQRLTLIALFALLAILITSVGFKLKSKNLSKSAAPVSAPVAPISPNPVPLGLLADRHNGDLKLSWNRESNAVRNATAGLLEIEDGKTTRKINLDPTQVRNGSILYAATSDQVQFQLTVLGSQTTSESVIVILPEARDTKVKTLATAKEVQAVAEPETKPALEGKPHRTPSKQFVASERHVSSSVPQLPSEPPALTAKTADSMSIATGLGGPVSPPAFQPATSPDASFESPATPASTAIPARVVSTEAVYYPPVVAGVVNPVYPPELRGLGLSSKTVDVKVTLDETGRLTKAEALTPKVWTPSTMIQSSLTAVRLWKFKPARKGNQPVPSEMVVQFSFKGIR